MARELGVARSLLDRSTKKSEEGKVDPLLGKGRFSSQNDELSLLRRENKRLHMERDVLIKTVAIFSEEPR